jgi:hypothetical protein
MADPFSTLGIPKSATTDEARAAYRKLASKHHPDKGGNAEIFKEVKAAFELIEAGYTEPPPRHAPSSSFTKASPVYEGTFNEFILALARTRSTVVRLRMRTRRLLRRFGLLVLVSLRRTGRQTFVRTRVSSLRTSRLLRRTKGSCATSQLKV